jgi:Putative polyhydroxyalkanoic acid system protein (PHA_gran_rgn)
MKVEHSPGVTTRLGSASQFRGFDMPTIRVAVPHKLTQDEALKRIKKTIAEAKKKNSDKVSELKETWDGYEGEFSGSAMGYDVGGGIAIEPAQVVVTGKLPFIAIPFKGKIESGIEGMLKRLLA